MKREKSIDDKGISVIRDINSAFTTCATLSPNPPPLSSQQDLSTKHLTDRLYVLIAFLHSLVLALDFWTFCLLLLLCLHAWYL